LVSLVVDESYRLRANSIIHAVVTGHCCDNSLLAPTAPLGTETASEIRIAGPGAPEVARWKLANQPHLL
jgi:hypothetical protein